MAHPSSSAGTGEPVHVHVPAGPMLFIEQFSLLHLLNRTVELEPTCDCGIRQHIFKPKFITINDLISFFF